jgi:hypothetical protein
MMPPALAFAQSSTDAQRSAIRSQCRGDYQAHCASVPPGGATSLQCLQKNMPSLSASCQAAVRAVEPPAAPKAESTRAAAPKAESAPAAEAVKPAASCGVWPSSLRRLHPRARVFWPSSQRDNRSA